MESFCRWKVFEVGDLVMFFEEVLVGVFFCFVFCIFFIFLKGEIEVEIWSCDWEVGNFNFFCVFWLGKDLGVVGFFIWVF